MAVILLCYAECAEDAGFSVCILITGLSQMGTFPWGIPASFPWEMPSCDGHSAHTQAQTHTHARTRTHSHACTHTDTETHTHTHTHSHTHTFTHTHIHTHTHMHTHTHTHTHTYTHTHADTDTETHTHILCLSPSFSLFFSPGSLSPAPVTAGAQSQLSVTIQCLIFFAELEPPPNTVKVPMSLWSFSQVGTMFSSW